MGSLFFSNNLNLRKKKLPPHPTTDSDLTTPSVSDSKNKKSTKGLFAKEREKQKRPPKPHRNRRNSDDSTHPLNRYIPGDDLRRHSAFSNMSSPRDSVNGGVPVGSDPMETTPAPETTATTNGTNGEHQTQEEERPTPPAHGKTTPPPPREIRPEDAEAFKATGNKFYKAGEYAKAIEEYTQGSFMK
jgi:DnaJ family protein C protein 7